MQKKVMQLLIGALLFPGILYSAEKYSQQDIELLSKAMYHEAYNQGDVGMLAVGLIVLARVKSLKFPDTITEVIKQKRQFPGIATAVIKDKVGMQKSRMLALKLVNNEVPSHPILDRIRQKRYMYYHTKALGLHKDCFVYKNHVFWGVDA